jgi:hypothetical protein
MNVNDSHVFLELIADFLWAKCRLDSIVHVIEGEAED